MQTSRRKFLKTSTIAAAGASLLSNKIFASSLKSSPKANEILGIQLYSVRIDMGKDPSGTLKQLAGMGYKYVEHANYANRKFYGYTPTDFKKLLDDLGLKMLSGHTVMGSNAWDKDKKGFTDSWKYTVEDASTVGQQYVISPWLDESLRKDYDGLLSFLDVFNKSGELCKAHGMKFGYHNHNFEFNSSLNNMKLYDIILQHTDPNLVAQQLDIGNMYGAGGRAADIIKQYPGRFELMHVKDEIKSAKSEMGDGYESTILGTGVIGTKDIIDLAKKSGGTKQFIIEQESYQDKTPLEAAKLDYDIMKKWGF
ncbi:MAG TPA: sugar phosphate isomerase/epimerase family protein [Puia sp.]|nr:sugar phosphate isomerase/epimerase family protein [Puia sp.]